MVRTKKKSSMGTGIAIAVAVVALVIVMVLAFGSGLSVNQAENLGLSSVDSGNIDVTQEFGKASTVGINAYTGDWGEAGSMTEVYPTYTILDSTGVKILADTLANSTGSTVGEKITIYPTGASYYFSPLVDFLVANEAPTVPEIQAEAIVATSDLVITAYDDDMTTALTADDNATNTADYAGGDLGADEVHKYYIKLENNVADKTFRLGGIMTYYCGDEVTDFSLEEAGWEESSFPNKGATKTAFSLVDDTGASTSCNFQHIYVPSDGDFISMKEWDDTGKLKFLVEAGSSQPAANGDSYVGATFVDYGCEISKEGPVVCGIFKADDNGDAGEIGLDEAPETTGYKSLDVGIAIELQ